MAGKEECALAHGEVRHDIEHVAHDERLGEDYGRYAHQAADAIAAAAGRIHNPDAERNPATAHPTAHSTTHPTAHRIDLGRRKRCAPQFHRRPDGALALAPRGRVHRIASLLHRARGSDSYQPGC